MGENEGIGKWAEGRKRGEETVGFPKAYIENGEKAASMVSQLYGHPPSFFFFPSFSFFFFTAVPFTGWPFPDTKCGKASGHHAEESGPNYSVLRRHPRVGPIPEED